MSLKHLLPKNRQISLIYDEFYDLLKDGKTSLFTI